jgi:hypothetical protein
MPKSQLTKLRQARIRCRRSILNTERLLADYQAKLAGLDAAIREIAPELDLTYYRRNPNPYFKPRELPRLALEVMKEAGQPLRSRVMVVRILARKGEELPAPALRKFTQHRLSAVLSVFQTRGVVRMTGNKREAWWGLV